MRTLYSNPNTRLRTMNFRAVRAPDDILPRDKFVLQEQERKHAMFFGLLKERIERHYMQTVQQWVSRLRKNRRLHRKLPRVPKRIAREIARLERRLNLRTK